MCGVHKKLLPLALLLIPEAASACPSCAASRNEQFFNQSLIAVGIMWLLPVTIAFFIGFKIYWMCKEKET